MINKMKIGILYICTGKYSVFWKDFYLSMEKNFVIDSEKHYFVFTDNPNIDFENTNSKIHKINQKDLGWPDNTLMRFHIFLQAEDKLMLMDYIFFFNSNLLVQNIITANDFLPSDSNNLTATIHPGFYNKKRSSFTYEKNKRSTAYIKKDQGEHYFAGGLNGGKTINYLEAIKIMRANIDIDIKNKIIAVWHDESHWNKFLIERSDLKILPPAYLYPEGWFLPFDPIILIRDKNKYGGHSFLRNEKSNFLEKIKRYFFK